MFEITAKEIKKELKRIAFFVQHSGLFDSFSPTTRRTLESLPVEWEAVQVDGETTLKWQDHPTWAEADLEGMLDDKPIKMKIKKSSSRNIYSIQYDGKKYTVENMPDLRKLFEDLQEGGTPKPKVMQESFDLLNKKKTHLNTQSKHYYLNDVSDGPWKLDITKDSSRIFVKFSVPSADEASKVKMDEKLEEQDKFRINTIGSYVKKLLQKEGLDISDLAFTQRLLNVSGKSGFLITIR